MTRSDLLKINAIFRIELPVNLAGENNEKNNNCETMKFILFKMEKRL